MTTARPRAVDTIEAFGNFKHTIQRAMLPLCKQHDLSIQQWRILHILTKHNSSEGMTVTELADIAQITPSAVSQFIDQLVDKSFVERQIDTDDRRVTIIRITPEAHDRLKTLHADQKKLLSGLFTCLTDEEVTTFVDILKKVSRHNAEQDKDNV